jgi:hypothetical protein
MTGSRDLIKQTTTYVHANKRQCDAGGVIRHRPMGRLFTFIFAAIALGFDLS